MPMPRSSAARGLDRVSRSPCQWMSPPSGWTSPARIFSSVDLPAPFSPTSACAEPSATAKLTPLSARTAPNDFLTSRNSSPRMPWRILLPFAGNRLQCAPMTRLLSSAAVLSTVLLATSIVVAAVQGPTLTPPRGSRPARTSFGATRDGKPVEMYTLTNANGIEVRAISYGGIITSLRTRDRGGQPGDIVLGFDKIDGYVKDPPPPFFGAIIGRYGNRIA